MSITLTDADGASLDVNAWNWGVLHYTLACCTPPLLPDEELLDQLRFGGVELAAAEAAEIRQYLLAVVLPRIGPGERMLADLSVTNVPDDGTFYRDDPAKNYSLSHEVLVSVIEFLGRARPPIRVG
ncbi:hypothetical protein F8S13_20620 [Chloroflexia bacterium SDU3-3]|nr:hypothetical protein F8S13_20620 [Chloroflexia bacterium SDU3-3]